MKSLVDGNSTVGRMSDQQDNLVEAVLVDSVTQSPTPGSEEGVPGKLPRSKGSWLGVVWKSMPSWLISTVVHVGAILALAAWNIEPIQKEIKLMLTAGEALDEGEDLEQVELAAAEASSLEVAESENIPSESPAVDTSTIAESDFSDVVLPSGPDLSMPSSASLAPASAMSAQSNAALKASLNGRSKEAKRELLKKFGGTSETERAVSMALKWLAEHQDKNTGAWTLAHGVVCNNQCDHSGRRQQSYNAATGLALLCFLGAGQTHMEGEYKEVVFKGLSFLIRNVKYQKGMGSWWVGSGSKGMDDMYAHGIATTALCEAFGMTRDPKLLEPAQAGVNFLAFAQNANTGGWHYAPGGLGDTSVVGWQMMALKSASMSGLAVDINVVRKANLFLDAMAWDNGTSYHYDFKKLASRAGYNASCTAAACLCRMYSGMKKDNEALQGMVEKFSKAGPSKSSTYYNYYATQVMKQYGGEAWEKWNAKMRDQLVSTQSQTGHSAGSWYWDDGHSTDSAGRFYTTCMATMILEVYYRYLPIYAEQEEEDAFAL